MQLRGRHRFGPVQIGGDSVTRSAATSTPPWVADHDDVTKFGTFPTEAAGAMSAGSGATGNRITTVERIGLLSKTCESSWARNSFTWSSTAALVSPTSRSAPTRKPLSPSTVRDAAELAWANERWGGVVRRAQRHSRTRAVRKCQLLPLIRLGRRGAQHQAQKDPSLPARDQRHVLSASTVHSSKDGLCVDDARFYDSEAELRTVLPGWLHF